MREYYKSIICIEHSVRTTNSPYFRVLILFEIQHECHILHVLKLCRALDVDERSLFAIFYVVAQNTGRLIPFWQLFWNYFEHRLSVRLF